MPKKALWILLPFLFIFLLGLFLLLQPQYKVQVTDLVTPSPGRRRRASDRRIGMMWLTQRSR